MLIFIALIPFRSHWQMLANFSQVEFQRTISKFRKRKSLSCVYVLQKNKIRKFCVVVVQRRQRNIQRAWRTFKAPPPPPPPTYLRVWMSGSPTCLMNPLLQIISGNKTLVQLTAMYLTPRFLLNANLPSGSSSSSSGSEGISTCNFFFKIRRI